MAEAFDEESALARHLAGSGVAQAQAGARGLGSALPERSNALNERSSHLAALIERQHVQNGALDMAASRLERLAELVCGPAPPIAATDRPQSSRLGQDLNAPKGPPTSAMGALRQGMASSEYLLGRVMAALGRLEEL